MDWYVLLCHVEVGGGKGAIVIVGCIDYWEGWVDCSMRNMSSSERSPSLNIWLSIQLWFSDGGVQCVKPTVATIFANSSVGSALDYQTPESNIAKKGSSGSSGIEACFGLCKLFRPMDYADSSPKLFRDVLC